MSVGRSMRIPLVALAGVFAAGLVFAPQAEGAKRQRFKYNPRAKKLSAGPLLNATAKWHGDSYARDYLSQKQYEEIRDGALAAFQHYDPRTHVFVGLGRSPTTIIAFLQNFGLTKAEALNLPASGMQGGNPDRAAWNKHLKRIIPKSVINGTKDVVIMDRTSSGTSLRDAASLLQAFLKAQGSKRKVKILSYDRHPELNLPRIDIRNNAELNEMNRYSAWAEFGKFEVGYTSPNTLVARPEYKQYKTALMKRMVRDPAVAKAFDNFFPESMGAADQVVEQPAAATFPGLVLNDRDGNPYQFLTQAEVAGGASAIRKLTGQFDPKKHHFVGVGRTSAPFVAFMKAMESGGAGYLPADGVTKSLTDQAQIDPGLHAAYAPFFASLVRDAVQKQKNKIVLMKRTNSGRSLLAVADLLRNYIAQQGLALQVDTVGFGTKGSRAPANMTHINIGDAPGLVQLFKDQAHRTISESETHRIGVDEAVVPQPNHQTYVDALTKTFAANPEL